MAWCARFFANFPRFFVDDYVLFAECRVAMRAQPGYAAGHYRARVRDVWKHGKASLRPFVDPEL